MKLIRNSRVALILGVVIWLFAIGFGLRIVLSFENTSGTSGISPVGWPVASKIARDPNLPTLVMMVHPQCPCSRASISELALLMTRESGRVNAEVVFVKQNGNDEKWKQTDLWHSAAIISGVHVSVDDGSEAQRFGSLTSGQVMLYSADGKLLFSGGMTSARGQVGDNDGRRSIHAFLAKGTTEISNTPVFGCPLFNSALTEQIKDPREVSQSK